MAPTGTEPRVALITGCSTGIGRALAQQLHDRGATVYATARNVATLEALADEQINVLALDVTDEASMIAAVEHIQDTHGRIDVLVNNAGYALQATIEQASIEEIRLQFETNVFGAMRLTQLALPGMRQRKRGTVVSVGSMGGRFTFPGSGYYHATKHALEAITDALRLEVAAFGIDVILIQPSTVSTPFGGTSVATNDDAPAADDPYGAFKREVADRYRNVYGDGARAISPGQVAATIVKAIDAEHPRARYAVGAQARMMMSGRRVLPDVAWDAVIKRSWPTPKA